MIDEYTRKCLAIEVGASLWAQDVILTLSRLMRIYSKPTYERSDNGAEFNASKVIRWLHDALIGPTFIASGSPWQNGFVESFNGKLRDGLLNRDMVLHPHLSQGPDRTLAVLLQRATATQHAWLQATSYKSPELVRTRYDRDRTYRLIGYKIHTQVSPAITRCARPTEADK